MFAQASFHECRLDIERRPCSGFLDTCCVRDLGWAKPWNIKSQSSVTLWEAHMHPRTEPAPEVGGQAVSGVLSQ